MDGFAKTSTKRVRGCLCETQISNRVSAFKYESWDLILETRQCTYEETEMAKVWTVNELKHIAETDDLHISPFREDATTYGTPTWIWSVVVGNDLYARAYNGKNSRWYQAAVAQRAGRIRCAGTTVDVSFESISGPLNEDIDNAYRKKYSDSEYLNSMITGKARNATVKITPR